MIATVREKHKKIHDRQNDIKDQHLAYMFLNVFLFGCACVRERERETEDGLYKSYNIEV